MSAVSMYKYYLAMLIWALLLEIMIFMYYIPRREFGIEFTLTLIVFLITVIGISFIIRKMRQEV